MVQNLTKKQNNALYYLRDNETTEVLFGGGAGGGKSFFGCLWVIENCQNYPGTRWVIGRSKLKSLKETTLNTFFDICSSLDLSEQFNYNAQTSVITWDNGSEIILKDLFLYPSDPEFDSLGSLEITGAFVDECNQITLKAWQILKSRIRYRLDEYDLTPKILGTCNPSKGWVYRLFYKPAKEGNQEVFRVFIVSLLDDNPHISKHYKQNLLTLDKVSRERLLFGNWEFDDDPSKLFKNYDKILELFTNRFIRPEGERYLTADIAYMGSDLFVIGIWHGLVIEKIYAFDKIDETQVAYKINEIRLEHKIPQTNICYDADGLKKYVKQSALTGYLKDATQFFNGSKARNGENYFNLKSQCYFYLANYIDDNKIYCEDQTYRDQIINELESIKQLPRDDNYQPLRLEKKADLKERLGHSPDFTDMMMMRMLFEISTEKKYITTESLSDLGINY